MIEMANVGAVNLPELVALRKESVDRNDGAHGSRDTHQRSLSARRAWIEISASGRRGTVSEVALRKESVDRNGGCKWGPGVPDVALRKESVDRNNAADALLKGSARRSPQGERG